MRILIAGGTGFVGRSIARSLLDRGHGVVVLSRDPHKAERIPALRGAESRRGDVTDPGSLRGVLDDVEAVVGVVQFPNYPVELPRRGLTFDRFDRRGTENLIAEAKRAGTHRYLYLSGAGADVTSDMPWYRAKGLAEQAVEESGLEFCILRPSWAYGPDDRALNRLARIARYSPVVPRLGLRAQMLQPVFVADIGTAAARIFETDAAWGETLEIGGPEVLTMEQILRTVFEVLGLKRWVVPVPTQLAKIGTAPLVVLPKPPMSPSGIEFAIQDAVVDNAALEKILELRPVPLREGLAHYLAEKGRAKGAA